MFQMKQICSVWSIKFNEFLLEIRHLNHYTLDMMKLDMICWMTDEGNEWLKEEFEDLTPELAIDYMKRTQGEAERLVEGWRRNGEEVGLTVVFEIGSLLKFNSIARTKLIDSALEDNELHSFI